MGRYDLVEQVLSEMKAEFFFTGAKIQPGRPVVFGKMWRGPVWRGHSCPRKLRRLISSAFPGIRSRQW